MKAILWLLIFCLGVIVLLGGFGFYVWDELWGYHPYIIEFRGASSYGQQVSFVAKRKPKQVGLTGIWRFEEDKTGKDILFRHDFVAIPKTGD